MSCNDYNLILDSSSGGDEPTPEYHLHLDGVGINGYSPTVNFVNQTTGSFQIQVNDVDGVKTSDAVPKYSYLTSNYVSNDSLATTLNGYLKVDGSNADNPITISGHTFESLYSGYNTKLTMTGAPAYIQAPLLVLKSTEQNGKVYYGSSNSSKELATIGDIPDVTTKLDTDGSNATDPITLNNITIDNSNDYITRITSPTSKGFQFGYSNNGVYRGSITFSDTLGYGQIRYYGSTLELSNGTGYLLKDNDTGSKTGKEIVVKSDISDATITLTQGGVTKGTFTLNGSATTIDLDAGGGTITNPLGIGYTQGSLNYSLNLGVDESTSKIISNYTIASSGSYFSTPIKLLNSKTAPITLTEDVNGLYTIGLDYDTATLGLDANNKLTVIGGGGGSYTAGTGIDITGGVISIDTSVVAQLSDIPDTSDMATQTWVGNQGYVTTSDLSTTLADYVLSSSLATVATSGSYSDLSNKPTIPTNSDYVDLSTDQTVGGTKTFSNDQKFGGVIYLDGSSNAQGVVHKVGSTRKELVLRNNSASMVYVGNTSDALNLRGSGARPTYYTSGTSKDIALYSDIPSLTNYVTTNTAQTITDVKTFTSDVILGNSNTYDITVKAYNSTADANVACMQLYNTTNTLYVGNTATNLDLRGYDTRPKYDGGYLALLADLPNKATSSTPGIVQPDNSTITVDANGVITSNVLTRNVGEIVHSLVPLTDAGLHLLDGAWIDANGSYADFVTYILSLYTDYPDLFTDETGYNNSITNYGVCGKFYYDQTNQRLKLPKITGIIEGTVDATALGDLVEAGLPNITGDFGGTISTSIPSGVFSQQNTLNPSHMVASVMGTGWTNYFNAYLSSSIYGNSNTVQPQTIKAYIYIVIATSVKTNLQVDIDDIATDLNSKADTDLANLNNTGKIAIAHNAMPSTTYVYLTLGVSGASYTAPSDGWVAVIGLANTAGDYIVLQSRVASSPIAIGAGQYLQTFIPVSKGDTFMLYYNTSQTSMSFYYANGSISEYTP